MSRFGGGALSEVDDVHRKLIGRLQFLQGIGQGVFHVAEFEWYGAHGAGDRHTFIASDSFELALEKACLAEGGRDQQEARVRHGEQGSLPGTASFNVRVVVELVHDDIVDFRLLAIAQGDVGQDLGGAAQDRCPAVDACVAGHHADIFRPEVAAEGEEFFIHQCLDRAGVDGLAALGG